MSIAFTALERRVLDLLCDGSCNKEIARTMGVGLHTAERRVESVMNKLGARSRLKAVCMAFRTGLVTLQPAPSSCDVPGLDTAREQAGRALWSCSAPPHPRSGSASALPPALAHQQAPTVETAVHHG